MYVLRFLHYWKAELKIDNVDAIHWNAGLWDTLKMAQDTICGQNTYVLWCAENGFLRKNGTPRATAEILYKYISQDIDFEEEHTGLADVLIEIQIFAKCMAQHKKMRRKVWG